MNKTNKKLLEKMISATELQIKKDAEAGKKDIWSSDLKRLKEELVDLECMKD